MIKFEVTDAVTFLSQQGFSKELLKYLVLDRYKAIVPLTKRSGVKALYRQLDLSIEQSNLLEKKYTDQFAMESTKGNDHASTFLKNYDSTEITAQRELRLDCLRDLTKLFREVEPDFPLYKKDRYSIVHERFEFFVKMFF